MSVLSNCGRFPIWDDVCNDLSGWYLRRYKYKEMHYLHRSMFNV